MQWLIDGNNLIKVLIKDYEEKTAVGAENGLVLAMFRTASAHRIETSEVFQKSWVNVKDRLPEPNSFCLTWSPEAGVEVLKYQCLSRNKGLLGFWRIEEGGCRYVGPGAVTHWMPLPEPPSEQ